jgi:two-component system sensor histidine kinase KdpD
MDATLITQVLLNLLENAARNSPERGMILVDLHKQADYARFEISDEGQGIPDEIVGNLFEANGPGRQAFIDSAPGIGLGLSICSTIIHAHGGAIEAHNREEGGARLIFKLPL